MKNKNMQKRTELHCRTKMSELAGVPSAEEWLKTAISWGTIGALAITDRNSVQSFAEAMHAMRRSDGSTTPVRVLYGADITMSENGTTTQCMVLAKNEAGKVNLFRLITEAYKGGVTSPVQVDREAFLRYREGLLIGASCDGEIWEALKEGAGQDELIKMMQFYDYIEVQPPGNMYGRDISSYKENVKTLLALAGKIGKKAVAVSNACFIDPSDQICYETICLSRGDDKEGKRSLYLRTTGEMLEEFAFLGEETAREIVLTNPDQIADMCEEFQPVPWTRYVLELPDVCEEIRSACMEKAHEIYGDNLPLPVEERMTEELRSIFSEGYATDYIVIKRFVDKSKELGYPVGSRGSAGSSFVVFLLGLTEINPLPAHYYCRDCGYFEYGSFKAKDSHLCGYDLPDKVCPKCGRPMKKAGFNIPVETFLGFRWNKPPVLNLIFASCIQKQMLQYAGEVFGKDRILCAGTINVLDRNAAIASLQECCDRNGMEVGVIFPETTEFDTEKAIQDLYGIKKRVKKHPGGVMILPEGVDVNEITPVQYVSLDNENEVRISHLEYRSFDHMITSYDLLSNDVPAMLHDLEQKTDFRLEDIPMDSKEVISLFWSRKALGLWDGGYPDSFYHGVLGILGFSDDDICEITNAAKPETFSDLVKINALAHGTDCWWDNAERWIMQKDAKLSEVIASRDDIMLYLMRVGVDKETAFFIMENVRKGKGLRAKDEDLLRSIDELPEWYIEACKTIRYLFPKAHAVDYAMMSFRLAYYKIYYPKAFYQVYMKYYGNSFLPDRLIDNPDALDDFISYYENMRSLTKYEEQVRKNLYVLHEALERGAATLEELLRNY